MTLTRTIPSPLGDLLITGDGTALTGLYFEPHPPIDGIAAPDGFKEAVAQLEEWFAGERSDFDLKLDPQGTAFQQRVWSVLREIPFGSTTSYLAVAMAAGNARAARPAGQAIGRNPIAIIVPCHRVIGSNGTLTGYAGGMHRKRWLLEHERTTDS